MKNKPIYPTPITSIEDVVYTGHYAPTFQEGMTLREHCASLNNAHLTDVFLNVIKINGDVLTPTQLAELAVTIAKVSVLSADALINELNQ